LVLDPDSGEASNHLAWALSSVPGDPWYNPTEALAFARKAVELQPGAWPFLNTLGVAAYRAKDWKTATEALQKSVTFTGGEAHDLFFLAMIHWQQGNKQLAQTCYDRADAWTEKNGPNDQELLRFRAEAAAVLGQPCAKPDAEKEHCEKKEMPTDTAREAKPPARDAIGPTSPKNQPATADRKQVVLDFSY